MNKTKEQMQKKWDYILIRGWTKEWNMALAANVFARYVHDDPNLNIKIDDFLELMRSNKLKRWASHIDRNGDKTTIFRMGVRLFIGNGCQSLSGYLFEDKFNAILALTMMDRFKFTQITTKESEMNSARKKKNRQVDRISIYRKGDPNSEWNTVS